MDKWIKAYFIPLAIQPLLKTDFPISVPYLLESNRSPKIYDLLSAYGICVLNHRLDLSTYLPVLNVN